MTDETRPLDPRGVRAATRRFRALVQPEPPHYIRCRLAAVRHARSAAVFGNEPRRRPRHRPAGARRSAASGHRRDSPPCRRTGRTCRSPPWNPGEMHACNRRRPRRDGRGLRLDRRPPRRVTGEVHAIFQPRTPPAGARKMGHRCRTSTSSGYHSRPSPRNDRREETGRPPRTRPLPPITVTGRGRACLDAGGHLFPWWQPPQLVEQLRTGRCPPGGGGVPTVVLDDVAGSPALMYTSSRKSARLGSSVRDHRPGSA